jgi:NAD(P)-dependent dehydrogenase (short-subunit alcohol dehydrogenase family)
MTATLQGCKVIVTGAARGIGRTLAFGLLDAGCRVTLMDWAAGTLAATAEEACARAGRDRVLSIVGNVSTEADAERVVAQTRAAFGGLDALVNNAGVGRAAVRADVMRNPYKLWELTADQWRRFFEVHVHGFFNMTRAALPGLLAQKRGRIVTVTTSLDHMIRAGSAGYGSAKAAMEASMAILAEELAGSGVTANVLVPGGPVNTPGVPDDGTIPRSAFIQAEVMVPPLVWLLSPVADAVNGRRFVAARWDASKAPEEAAERAGAPAAWPQLGKQAIMPAGLR